MFIFTQNKIEAIYLRKTNKIINVLNSKKSILNKNNGSKDFLINFDALFHIESKILQYI
jgi:hypothetical protein